jgi:hypothetical protein
MPAPEEEVSNVHPTRTDASIIRCDLKRGQLELYLTVSPHGWRVLAVIKLGCERLGLQSKGKRREGAIGRERPAGRGGEKYVGVSE